MAILDIYCKPDHPLLGSVSQSQILAASLGIILFTLAALGLFLENEFIVLPYIGLSSLLFAFIYFLSIRIIYASRANDPKEDKSHTETSDLSFKAVVLRYALFASVIVAAALFLPHFAEQIAEKTGLGKSFIGTLLLAVSTSLPEIAVSIAAVRMGAVDMAVGNLLGSNLFNMFILFLDDVFYLPGPILKSASDNLIIPAMSAIIMSAITVIGISHKNKVKGFWMAWDTLLILFVYLIGLAILYKLS
jgi:cation:H+ antiporter